MSSRLWRAACALSGLLSAALAQPIDVWSRPVRAERTHDFDALHYRIDLRLDPETRSFSGATTVTLRSLREDRTECRLDAETFVVADVTAPNGQALVWSQDSGMLRIIAPRPLSYGDTLQFTVRYGAEGVDVDEERYGMSKGYDLGLSFKPETAERPAIINTLSFPTGARHWFPCYDHPNDKATTEVIATVPAEMGVLSNGRRISDVRHADGTRTVHWRQEQPHATYLTVLVAGDYRIVSDTVGTLPIAYWVYPSREQDARITFGMTRSVLEFFEEEFGVPYPWAKYDQITIPGIGGGAESTTATVIGESAVVDERAALDDPSGWLVAHELAHQWWGDLTTLRDWSQTWLNESFATFYEYVWSARTYGPEEGAWNLDAKRRQYLNEARTRYQRPIVFDRWNVPNDNFDAHTYPKGALVLHMLHEQLGDTAFRASIRRFLATHAFGSVDTRDLLTAIHEATGRSVEGFFDQWIFSAGHPVLQVAWKWDATERTVDLHVQQTQFGTPHVPLFSLDVEVLVASSRGTSAHTVHLTKVDETFSLPAIGEPQMVVVDPRRVLLADIRETPSMAEELYRLEHGGTIVRRTTIERLRSWIDTANVRSALMHTASSDRFWRIRAQAADALGGANDMLVHRSLELLLDDPASGVRMAAARTLGAVGSVESAPLLRKLAETDPSYRVVAEACRALGRCGGTSDIPMLEELAKARSHRNIIAGAAGEALARLKGPK